MKSRDKDVILVTSQSSQQLNFQTMTRIHQSGPFMRTVCVSD